MCEYVTTDQIVRYSSVCCHAQLCRPVQMCRTIPRATSTAHGDLNDRNVGCVSLWLPGERRSWRGIPRPQSHLCAVPRQPGLCVGGTAAPSGRKVGRCVQLGCVSVRDTLQIFNIPVCKRSSVDSGKLVATATALPHWKGSVVAPVLHANSVKSRGFNAAILVQRRRPLYSHVCDIGGTAVMYAAPRVNCATQRRHYRGAAVVILLVRYVAQHSGTSATTCMYLAR